MIVQKFQNKLDSDTERLEIGRSTSGCSDYFKCTSRVNEALISNFSLKIAIVSKIDQRVRVFYKYTRLSENAGSAS